MKDVEPASLSEVRPLSGGLKGKELVLEVTALQIRIRELLLCVILLDEIQNNSCSLPKDDVGVWILDRCDTSVEDCFTSNPRIGRAWNAAVWVDIGERLGFHILERERVDFVGNT